jgi:ParB family chromosome partitioning protein
VRQEADEQSVDGLAVSIERFGLQQPIRVRRDGDKLVVVFGHRRLLAARKAGLKVVPVIIEDRELSAAEVIARQLLENCQRRNLSPVETAYALKDLIEEAGWSPKEIAEKLGFSLPGISKLLSLLKLGADTLEKVRSGAIPASTGYEIAKVDDPAKQTELARQVAAEQLTREETSELIRRESNGTVPSDNPTPATAKAEPGAGRSEAVHGPAMTLANFICKNCLRRLARCAQIELKTFWKLLKEQSQAQ